MTRAVIALANGGLFGAGLLFDSMTDTAKVPGSLDVARASNLTLAFCKGRRDGANDNRQAPDPHPKTCG
ncbi:MAG: hypothetical protein AAGK77_01565 [Pseudomonadota bacterium]